VDAVSTHFDYHRTMTQASTGSQSYRTRPEFANLSDFAAQLQQHRVSSGISTEEKQFLGRLRNYIEQLQQEGVSQSEIAQTLGVGMGWIVQITANNTPWMETLCAGVAGMTAGGAGTQNPATTNQGGGGSS
jgi:hypothetical protein